MTEAFHIAVSCNERYIPGALVALAGVAVHARPETTLAFHVFTEDVKDESVAFMRATLRRLHPNCDLVQHVCDEDLLKGLPYWAGSRMAAVRCYHATLMPDVDWCLYLDCDVLYLASVEEHFSHRDEGVLACVVQEESERTRRGECAWIHAHVGGSEGVTDGNYFNSGVVLFNLKKMREEGIPERLARFFREHPDVPSPDQDALNATFAGNVRMIPPKFDRLQVYLTDEKLAERPVIHYVEGNPWLPNLCCVANGRFRLWHRFADRYVWQRPGASISRCFSRRILVAKHVLHWILRIPLLGRAFAEALQRLGLIVNAKAWHRNQVGCRCSASALKEVLDA